LVRVILQNSWDLVLNFAKRKVISGSIFGTGILFLSIVVSSNAPAQDFTNELKYMRQLNIGDSLLNQNKFDESRTAYSLATQLCPNDIFKRCYANYKTGYSYLAENDGFLGLAYFTDILLTFTPKSAYDSAFQLLVTTEGDFLAMKVLSPTYNFNRLKIKYYSYRKELSPWERARFEFLIGAIYFKRLDYNNAIKSFKKSLTFQKTDEWLREHTLFNIGSAYLNLQDFQKAEDVFLHLRNKGGRHIKLLEVYDMLGKTYMLGHDFNKAILYFNKTVELSSKTNSDKKLVELYIEIGNCELELGENDLAYAMFDKAELICLSGQVESKELVFPLIAKANYFEILNNLDKQKECLLKALIYLDKNDDISLRSSVVNDLSRLYYKEKNYGLVIILVDLFNFRYKPLSSVELANSVGWTRYQDILQVRAESAYKLWQADTSNLKLLERAHEYYNDVLKVVSSGFFSLESEESKKSELKRVRDVYTGAFLATYDLYRSTHDQELLDELFKGVENSKANLFKTNLLNSKAVEFSGLPVNYQQMVGQLKKQISWLRYNLNNIQDKAETSRNIPNLQNELAFAEMKYDSLINILETKYPQFNHQGADEHIYKISSLQKKIQGDQVILNYFLTDDRLFVFIVSRESTEINEVKVDSNFIEKLQEFRNYIDHPVLGGDINQYCYEFGNLSNYLYRSLIRPFENKLLANRLIIIPDRELNLIPFHTLISDTIGISLGDFSKLHYLVYSYPITTLYSVEQMFSEPNYLTDKSKYLGFAPEYPANSNFVSLPGANYEITKTSKYFKGKFYQDADATKAKFLKNCSNYDIVHLALHADINEAEPLYSKLYFSSDDAEKTESMFAYEIFEYPMKAKLLVLSGCNTGYGKLEFGEGMENLARAFFYNGVENIIATHWSVADRSSANLIDYFYSYLLKNEPADVAMQKAKIDFLMYEDPLRSQPYYWAGYICIGNPVTFKTNHFRWILLLVVLALSGMFFYIRKLYLHRISPN
jgi:CHAT domain-containing protein/tetratricopeptide (TPR) repeat protein